MPRLVTPATDYQASFLAALVECHEERRHLELGLATLRDRTRSPATSPPCGPKSTSRRPTTRAACRRRTCGGSTATSSWDASPCATGSTSACAASAATSATRPDRAAATSATPRAMLAATLPLGSRSGHRPGAHHLRRGHTISRRVIEANGGRYAGRDGDELHFWVPSRSGVAAPDTPPRGPETPPGGVGPAPGSARLALALGLAVAQVAQVARPDLSTR